MRCDARHLSASGPLKPDRPQTVARLQRALAAAESAASVAAWARDAAEARAAAAETATAAAKAAADTAAGSAGAKAPAAGHAASLPPVASAGPGQPAAAAEDSEVHCGSDGDAAALQEARQNIAHMREQLAAAAAELEERQVLFTHHVLQSRFYDVCATCHLMHISLHKWRRLANGVASVTNCGDFGLIPVIWAPQPTGAWHMTGVAGHLTFCPLMPGCSLRT